MSTLFYIIFSTFLISLISFVGALTLFLREKFLNRILLSLVALSAGSLLGAAFLHLIPDSIERIDLSGESSILQPFFYLLLGFCLFFVLEQFLGWHHHHHTREQSKIKPFSYLILISDSFHNFIDGLIIAASFLISLPVGLVSAFAVASHEIPQEIGDFGVLIYGGFKKSRALLLNFLSALGAILGGVSGFLLAGKIGQSIIFLLPFAAGHFIYVACSDLIPEIKHKTTIKKSIANFLVFLAGIGIMILFAIFCE